MRTSIPTFFCIKIKYEMREEIPLNILECSYRDHLKDLEDKLGIHFDYIEVKENQTKLFCSPKNQPFEFGQRNRMRHMNSPKEIKVDIDEALTDACEKVFSVFEAQIKTPIDIQWESI